MNSRFSWPIIRQAREYSQKHPAPLIFNIAGTGAGHNSALLKVMQKAVYMAGFHVVSLPSPTHSNFIVSASSTGVPGRVEDDAADLYRVMKLAYERVKDRIIALKDWDSGSDRDFTVTGRHSRRFYRYATRWMVNEVNWHRAQSAGHGPSLDAVRAFASAKIGQLGMWWTCREVERG